MNPLAAIAAYRNVILGVAILLALGGLYLKGHHDGAASVQAKWDAANAKAVQDQLVTEQQHRATEQNLRQLADDTQQGGTHAIQSVYDYYAKHPTLEYRDAGGVCHSGSAVAPGGVPQAPGASGDPETVAADDGHAPAGSTFPIQVIDPNLPERCAETTVMYLTCRDYVQALTPLANEHDPPR